MAKAVRARPLLPADLQEHVVYAEPREFDGVDWRDLAELRERLAKLEQRNSGNDASAATRSNIWAAVVGGIVGALISALSTAAVSSVLERPQNPPPLGQPQIQQTP